jgi:hypothetical protein
MQIKTLSLIISAVLPLISPIVYSKAILKGDAKPHRTTRFVLLLINALATASLFAQHNNVAIWLAGVSLLQSMIIFVLSVKHGIGGWAKTDLLCLFIALIGIIAWQTTKHPLLALYCAILADFTGMVPTIFKTYLHPDTEVWEFFIIDVFAGAFNILALKTYSLSDFSYPLYIILINLLIFILVLRPKFSKR